MRAHGEPDDGPENRSALAAIVARVCPRCRRGPIFASMWVMHDDCPACGLDFDRGDPGYFTGAMYVSYALAIPLIALLTLIEHLIIPELVAVPAGRAGLAHLRAADPLDLAIFAGDLDLLRPLLRPGRRAGRGSRRATPTNEPICEGNREHVATRGNRAHFGRSPRWPRDLKIDCRASRAVRPRQGEGAARGPATAPRRRGRAASLILVSAITPTPAGEGKTTTSIGLAQGLRRIGKNAALALRQPSMGPVFGRKGGATGGGASRVEPSNTINLQFTGDFHAITAAHNLLAAAIDNRLHFRRHRPRPDAGPLEARPGHERPGAAAHRHRPGRPLAGRARASRASTSRRPARSWPSSAWPTRRPTSAPGSTASSSATPTEGEPVLAERDRRDRLDGGDPERGDPAQPRPDDRVDARVRPRRAVRQHRPRLQLDPRHPDGPGHGRLRRDRGRLRLRPGRREVLRPQVPRRRAQPGRDRARRHDPGAQDARRRRARRARRARTRRPSSGGWRTWPPTSTARRTSASRRSSPSTSSAPTRPRSSRSSTTIAPAAASPCATADVFGAGGGGAIELAEKVVAAAAGPATPLKPLYPLDWPAEQKIEQIARIMYGADGVTILPAADGQAPQGRQARLRRAADLHGQDAGLALRQPQAPRPAAGASR